MKAAEQMEMPPFDFLIAEGDPYSELTRIADGGAGRRRW